MKSYTCILFFLTLSIAAEAQNWRLIEYKKQEYQSSDSTQYFTKDSVRYIYDYINGRGGLPGYAAAKYYDTTKYSEKKVYHRQKAGATLDYKEYWRADFLPDDNIHIRQRFTPGKSTPSFVDSFKYQNGLFREIVLSKWDSLWGWFGYEKRNFSYDNFNNIAHIIVSYRMVAPMSWSGADTYHFFYNSGNKLASHEHSSPNNMNFWIWKHEYIYDTAGKLTQTFFGHYRHNKEFDTSRYTLHYHDASGLPRVDSIFGYPDSTYSSHYIYRYNTNGLLAQTDYYSYDVKKYTEYYTYEIYWPKSISDTKNNSIRIDLFPNPATYTLNVSVNFMNAKDINFSIVDVQGRLYREWSDKVSGNLYQQQISVADLPRGIYMLRVDDGDSRGARQFVIK